MVYDALYVSVGVHLVLYVGVLAHRLVCKYFDAQRFVCVVSKCVLWYTVIGMQVLWYVNVVVKGASELKIVRCEECSAFSTACTSVGRGAGEADQDERGDANPPAVSQPVSDGRLWYLLRSETVNRDESTAYSRGESKVETDETTVR